MSLESHNWKDRLTGIERGHQLTDAVDQYVSIMHRGQPICRWLDFDVSRSMLVTANPMVGLR